MIGDESMLMWHSAEVALHCVVGGTEAKTGHQIHTQLNWIFEDVEVGFMLVGHTHTDIDATFSVFSKKLKDNDAYTMKQLFSLIESSHKIPPKCIELDHIADWHRVVDRYVDRTIVGVSKPHLFKFFMRDGSPVIVYKKYCTNAEWTPEGRPVHWFPVVDGQYAGPSSPPQPCVIPRAAKDDFRMARDSVQKFVDVLKQHRHMWQTYRKEEVDKREDALSYWKAIFVEADDMIQKQKKKETEEGEEKDVLGAHEPEIYPHAFWPQSVETADEVQEVDPPSPDASLIYVGPRAGCPKVDFDPWCHINKGDFLIVRPPDEELSQGVPFWVGRAQSEVVDDRSSPHFWLFTYIVGSKFKAVMSRPDVDGRSDLVRVGQSHYDYGMRAVISVLRAAGAVKQKYAEDMQEGVLMLKAIRDVNIPKFLGHDIPLFEGILMDLFPGVVLPVPTYQVMKNMLLGNCKKLNLQPTPLFLEKLQLPSLRDRRPSPAVRFGSPVELRRSLSPSSTARFAAMEGGDSDDGGKLTTTESGEDCRENESADPCAEEEGHVVHGVQGLDTAAICDAVVQVFYALGCGVLPRAAPRWWIKRRTGGAWEDLRQCDDATEYFRDKLHMSPHVFREIPEALSSFLQRRVTFYREPLPPDHIVMYALYRWPSGET
ncbi:hypothetical protein CBR_g31463 [Chara braunii]|uniref:Uncharacterized protein n=1 Tax=Chara braunii TaxID=69332 RepID=A0A388LF70_CHABU|nr:hypothetical protein CBR_g31463 [Chara braunii]|eukprot:GBG80907.1 hypothetical protein CBR_g31463 [Chara braunii]